MKVIFSKHAQKRLKDKRQKGIKYSDIAINARKLKANLKSPIKLKAKTKDGKIFNYVAKDINRGRLIITIIGNRRKNK